MRPPVESKRLSPSERARWERVEGIVFDVQRYSVHDGPGLRTNVFLKGCPLRCHWCANPESQRLQPELALVANNCIECGQFDQPCPICWPVDSRAGQGEALARKYEPRTALCPTGAIHWIGQRRTAGEVIDEVLRDRPFYGDEGGLTLTGGEPTMQPDMAEALLRLARAEDISTAMETCGQTHWAVLARLLPFLDQVLFDLKHVDSELHRSFTGLGNELILANLRRLAAREVPVTVRVPLIPGFNASPETMQAIAGLVLSLDGSVTRIDLLPYHTLGQAKYAALGRDYPWAAYDRLSDEEVATLAEAVEAHGLTVTVGG